MTRNLSKFSGFLLSLVVLLMLLREIERYYAYASLIAFLGSVFFLDFFSKNKNPLRYSDLVLPFILFLCFFKNVFVFIYYDKSFVLLAKDFAAIVLVFSFVLWVRNRFFYSGLLTFAVSLFLYGIFLCLYGFFSSGAVTYFLPNYAPALLLPLVSLLLANKIYKEGLRGAGLFCVFVFSLWFSFYFEARGVSLALVLLFCVFFGMHFSSKFVAFSVVSFLSLIAFLTFYIGFEKGGDVYWNSLLTWRPAIWAHYLSELTSHSIYLGLGPISEESSFLAADAVRFLAGSSSELYGPHSLFVTFIYSYGLLGFLVIAFLLVKGLMNYNSNFFLPFVTAIFMSLFSTVYIGAPYIYGVFLTLMFCAIRNNFTVNPYSG